MNKTEKIRTTKDILEQRVSRIETVRYLMEHLTSYCAEVKNWEAELKPIVNKLEEYLISKNVDVNDPDIGSLAADIVHHGMMFLGSNPLFTSHEMVEAGGKLSPKENETFIAELKKIAKQPSKALKLLPYVAAVGYYMLTKTVMSNPIMQAAIEAQMQEMRYPIAASLMKANTKSTLKPLEMGLQLLKSLNEFDVDVAADGTVVDPQGNYAKEIEKLQRHERNRSKNSPESEGN